MTRIVATIAHARRASLAGQGVLCAPGLRAWAQRHGIDLRRAACEGLPVEELERIGDAFSLRVAAIARAEREDQE
ncbi:hypothetical protein [Luteimonas terricola]|uniref:DUF1127 domain-containing protein n=1 Tax=Luteimonas terricola TaxID=645597 RepID=A0ABQ2EDX7_9GAMM|nr:hypothetical protein [Luteimonas terricola]GGK08505.1 hypothetical protein GCM10011394_17360 [Luteimonas terricola]